MGLAMWGCWNFSCCKTSVVRKKITVQLVNMSRLGQLATLIFILKKFTFPPQTVFHPPTLALAPKFLAILDIFLVVLDIFPVILDISPLSLIFPGYPLYFTIILDISTLYLTFPHYPWYLPSSKKFSFSPQRSTHQHQHQLPKSPLSLIFPGFP